MPGELTSPQMTEAEWLRCQEPRPMLAFLGPKPSERKLRLFAVACCRRVWKRLPPEGQRLVELAEGYADATVTFAELSRAVREARRNSSRMNLALLAASPDTMTPHRAEGVADVAYQVVRAAFGLGMEERDRQARSLRDLFAPFGPAGFDPGWRTRNVLDLARTIYEDRCFERMPILADALQDAGCEDDEILDHCRSPREHVRGCWVLDAVLGKS